MEKIKIMDNKKIALELIEFCSNKKEEALKEYGRYNGFSSQIIRTKEEENLNYMQMGVMAEFTEVMADFWNGKYKNAIGEFEKLFNSSEEAKEYAKNYEK